MRFLALVPFLTMLACEDKEEDSAVESEEASEVEESEESEEQEEETE